MKNSISKVLLVLLFSGLPAVSVAFAQMGSDGSRLPFLADAVTARKLIHPRVDCANDPGDIIALDTSNGASLDDHGKLVADLEAAGFTVRTLDLEADGIPACVRHLMITTQRFTVCLTTPYPPPRVDLVVNGVRSGLGLLLLNEWGPICGAGTAPLADALGADWNANADASETHLAGFQFDPDYRATLFRGVDSWTEIAGSDYSAFTRVAARTDAGQPALIAGRVERGCVVIAGDSDWIADRWIDRSNNRALASNTFAFLNECTRRRLEIDLEPGRNPNCVSPHAMGRVAVTIHGTEAFDATAVDPSSLSFGGAAAVGCSRRDVPKEGPIGVFSRDGRTDLLCHFRTWEVAWPSRGANCAEVVLTGELEGGETIEGRDMVCLPGEPTCEASVPIPLD